MSGKRRSEVDKTTWGGNHYHVKQFGIEEADDGTDCVRELSRDPGGGPLVVKIPEDEQLYSSLALAAKAVGDELYYEIMSAHTSQP
jgi:hypothetical protein